MEIEKDSVDNHEGIEEAEPSTKVASASAMVLINGMEQPVTADQDNSDMQIGEGNFLGDWGIEDVLPLNSLINEEEEDPEF